MIEFVAFIIGVIGTFASISTMPEGFLRSLFLTFSILAILFSITLYLSKKFYLFYSLNILKNFKKQGITNIHLVGQNDETKIEYIRNARKIRILAISGLMFLRRFKESLIYALTKNVEIQILIADPNSPIVSEYELLESNARVGQIVPEIEQAKRLFEEYCDDAKKENKSSEIGAIRVKYFNSQFRIPMILIDNKFAWATITLPPKRSIDSISVEVQNDNSVFFQDCLNHFERMWGLIKDESKYPKVP